jgi:hypothetical protein
VERLAHMKTILKIKAKRKAPYYQLQSESHRWINENKKYQSRTLIGAKSKMRIFNKYLTKNGCETDIVIVHISYNKGNQVCTRI